MVTQKVFCKKCGMILDSHMIVHLGEWVLAVSPCPQCLRDTGIPMDDTGDRDTLPDEAQMVRTHEHEIGKKEIETTQHEVDRAKVGY